MLPLSHRAGGSQAYKLVLPGRRRRQEPELQTHEGYEWLYVLDGDLRVVLGEHDLVLRPGERRTCGRRRAGAERRLLDRSTCSLWSPTALSPHVRVPSTPRVDRGKTVAHGKGMSRPISGDPRPHVGALRDDATTMLVE